MNKKILDLLCENARYSNDEIAVMLGVSADEVKAAIAEMEAAGIICGYTTLINYEKTENEDVTALIELKVTPQPDAGFEDIAKKIKEFKEVESVSLMSGGFDFAVTVKGANLRDVAMFVAKRLSTLEGVLSTATHFVLRKYKDMGVDLAEKSANDRRVMPF
ncbi:MAG: Lrp/AsnC family transcriptional regulator [Clostridia bacterium]|nr:Lrp/AsnC family transcriptional regulator [Clostridia bacterium]